MEVAGQLEDIETNRETPEFFTYRAYLDNKSPGAALASAKFYRMNDPFGSTKFSDKLNDCRRFAWFIRHKETGKVRVASKQCRLRWCFHCSEARQQFITQAVKGWWNEAKRPKLLTLTLKHNDDSLQDQIDFLYKSFAKFRNRKYVKDRTRGGVWFFQVTYNQKDKQWHPHLHVLLDSEFLDHTKIMQLWFKITKTSNVVHIRKVEDLDKTLSHNARYAARPSALLKIPEELWPDLFEAFNGRRICGTYGDAREISLRPSKPEDAGSWLAIGDFKTVQSLKDNDENAWQIWKAWLQGKPLEKDVTMKQIDDFIEDFEPDIRPPPKWVTEPMFTSMSANR